LKRAKSLYTLRVVSPQTVYNPLPSTFINVEAQHRSNAAGGFMNHRSSLFRVLLSALAITTFSLSIFADTVRLKDGSLIKGTIVNFAEGRFTIAIGEGSRRRELTLSAEEIASIEFEPRSSTDTAFRTNPAATNSKIVPISTKPAPKVAAEESKTVSSVPSEVEVNRASVETVQKTSPPVTIAPNRTGSVRTSTAAPIGFNVRVLADNTANGWTNSGFVVKKGQRIRIIGSGSVSLGRGQTSTASGLPDLEDTEKLLKAVPTGALLAVIGDDNNDFIYIGSSREFTAGRDGTLYLGVNEGNLGDNTGAFNVKIEIDPQPET
jgi:hypothetical protein